jgi:uncharacterized membrane protein YhaH (DUF805 family)
MLALLPYIEKAMLVANLTSSGYSSRKSSHENCLFWIVIGLSVISYLLIVTGLGLYLAAHYELPIAFMVTGLVILFTVLFALAVARIYKKMRSRRIENSMKSVTDEVTKIISNLGDDVGGAFKDNAGLAAIVVAGLGFLAARKIF